MKGRYMKGEERVRQLFHKSTPTDLPILLSHLRMFLMKPKNQPFEGNSVRQAYYDLPSEHVGPPIQFVVHPHDPTQCNTDMCQPHRYIYYLWSALYDSVHLELYVINIVLLKTSIFTWWNIIMKTWNDLIPDLIP